MICTVKCSTDRVPVLKLLLF